MPTLLCKKIANKRLQKITGTVAAVLQLASASISSQARRRAASASMRAA
jgi:hypothetical protein